ncbi:MAG: hypothetical protein AB8B72_01480 [Crocinitomicaceae bacterium]
MYPKRIINFISICLLIISSIAVVRQVVDFSENYSNLTSIDSVLTLVMIAFIIFGLLSSVAILKKRKWGWIGLTSQLIYSLVWISLNYSVVEVHWLTILIVLVIFLGIIAFFFTKAVRDYFGIKKFDLLLTFIIPAVVFCILINEPIETGATSINTYYLEFKNEKYYFNDSLFSGNSFYNHQNGQTEFYGKLEEGLAQGEWNYFDEEGNLISTSNFKNGLLHGAETNYFSWGGVSEKKSYRNDTLDGDYELWFSEKEPRTKGNYNMGLKQGEWLNYDINSNIIKVDVYNLDKIDSSYYIN